MGESLLFEKGWIKNGSGFSQLLFPNFLLIIINSFWIAPRFLNRYAAANFF